MLKRFFIILIYFFFLIGCSQNDRVEKSIETSTIIPTHITTSSVINSSTPSPSPEPQAGEIEHVPNEVTSTATPALNEISIAGIEARNIDDIRMIAESGMTWIRRNGLLWHLVEPVQGDRNWAAVESLESELIEASKLGLTTILIVRSTPDWAQKVSGFYCGPVREDQLSSMGDFLSDAVNRYSQPPYNVKFWELGNEPDVNVFSSRPDMQYGCWGDNSDIYFGGGFYAQMLKTVYPRIKAADPEAQVLIGGLLMDCDPVNPPEVQSGSGQLKDCRPATFLEGVLNNDGGNYFDGVAFHAYDYYLGNIGEYGNPNWHSSWNSTGPVIEAKVNYLRSVLESYGYGGKYLINTEGALICGRYGNEPPCKTDSFYQTKASYLIQSYTISRALGLSANIWYSLRGWRGSGLIDNERNANLAYNALIFNTSILDKVNYLGEITDYEGIKGYVFENQNSTMWIIWSSDGLNHIIKPDIPPDLIYDYLGFELTGVVEVSIGNYPTYLIWDKSP